MSAAALDRTLAALADPHRRRVIELLRERPRRAGELADAVGLNPPIGGTGRLLSSAVVAVVTGSLPCCCRRR